MNMHCVCNLGEANKKSGWHCIGHLQGRGQTVWSPSQINQRPVPNTLTLYLADCSSRLAGHSLLIVI
ncbi:hypothetical protein J6590_009641 [Homalodisca vitripennis]|nr:hypothetical protein J6590_009641 [Homalodisca vitripennis]